MAWEPWVVFSAWSDCVQSKLMVYSKNVARTCVFTLWKSEDSRRGLLDQKEATWALISLIKDTGTALKLSTSKSNLLGSGVVWIDATGLPCWLDFLLVEYCTQIIDWMCPIFGIMFSMSNFKRSHSLHLYTIYKPYRLRTGPFTHDKIRLYANDRVDSAAFDDARNSLRNIQCIKNRVILACVDTQLGRSFDHWRFATSLGNDQDLYIHIIILSKTWGKSVTKWWDGVGWSREIVCVNESVVIFRATVTLSDVTLANYGSLDKLIVCLSSFTESEVMTICRSITDVVVDLIKRVDLVLFYKASRRGNVRSVEGSVTIKGASAGHVKLRRPTSKVPLWAEW